MTTMTDGGPSNQPTNFLSPGLAERACGEAFELKFQLSSPEADFIEAWARRRLEPDLHGVEGVYRVSSIYFDTPRLDVFHRVAGFKKRKFRARRYGDAEHIFLERKTKRGDRVRKKRVQIAPDELHRLLDLETDPAWAAAWFHRRIVAKNLRPIANVSYERTAFFGQFGAQPIRLTLDRHLIGAPTNDWRFAAITQGERLLGGGGAALLEMKYHLALPEALRDLMPHLPAQPARISKYRQCIELCGLAGRSDSTSSVCAVP